MAFIPHNIERRRYRFHIPSASYRAWDAAGRFYYVSRGHGAWTARCRDENLPTLSGQTLVSLSALLEARH